MSSMDEIIVKRKKILFSVLDYGIESKFVATIKDFNYKDKKQIVLLLRHYRKNVIIHDDEEKRLINQMIVNKKNIPDIIYERNIPKLEFKKESKMLQSITKDESYDINIIKEKIKKKKEITKKYEKIKVEIINNLSLLSLEELVQEAYNRLEITKKYIEIVTEDLKNGI